VELVPKSIFNAEKLVFHSLRNPSMHTHTRVCVRMHEACICRAWTCVRIHVYAYACPRVSVVFIFQK